MCLIIHNSKGNRIRRDHIQFAYANNPDGFGVMWTNPHYDDGKVHVLQGLFTLPEIYDILGHLDGIKHTIHFRYCTRGEVSSDMTHPFNVLSRSNNDTEDLWMMHNGTFTNLKVDPKRSDTSLFAESLGSKLRELGTSDQLFEKETRAAMAKHVGSYNKIVFMRHDGKVGIVNKSQGNVIDGMWYSNTYSLQPNYRASQSVVKSYGNWGNIFEKKTVKPEPVKLTKEDFEKWDAKRKQDERKEIANKNQAKPSIKTQPVTAVKVVKKPKLTSLSDMDAIEQAVHRIVEVRKMKKGEFFYTTANARVRVKVDTKEDGTPTISILAYQDEKPKVLVAE